MRIVIFITVALFLVGCFTTIIKVKCIGECEIEAERSIEIIPDI